MNKLHEQELMEAEQIEKESFKVTDKEQAGWALRKIKAYKEQIKETREISDREAYRIYEWERQEVKNAEDSIAYFESILRDYLHSVGDKKISLPHGTIRFKKQQPLWERDEEKLMQMVEEDFIKVEKSLKWGELKKMLVVDEGNIIRKDTGEVLKCVKVIEREDKFEVVL